MCICYFFRKGTDLFSGHSIARFLTLSIIVTLDQKLLCCKGAVMCVVRCLTASSPLPTSCQKYSCCCEDEKCLQKLLNVSCRVRGLSLVENRWCKDWCCGFISNQREKRRFVFEIFLNDLLHNHDFHLCLVVLCDKTILKCQQTSKAKIIHTPITLLKLYFNWSILPSSSHLFVYSYLTHCTYFVERIL